MIQARASQGLGVHPLLCYVVPVEGSCTPPEVSLTPDQGTTLLSVMPQS